MQSSAQTCSSGSPSAAGCPVDLLDRSMAAAGEGRHAWLAPAAGISVLSSAISATARPGGPVRSEHEAATRKSTAPHRVAGAPWGGSD